MSTKKNWTMRAAVLMLALVLVTSCFVGGTFAKYVTKGEGSDTARVAKFGVTVDVSSESMFTTNYNTDNTDLKDTLTYSVSSAAGENGTRDRLVAPGTKEDNALTFSVTGQPEVAVNVKFDFTVNSDVVLKHGYYKDYTKAPYDSNFNVVVDYYPVVFTLKQDGAIKMVGNLNDIKAYLESAEVSKNYEANTNLSTVLGTYTLSWEWAFEAPENSPIIDEEDTLLGNLAASDTYKTAGKWTNNSFVDIEDTDYSTNIDFSLAITVTQID